MAQAFAQNRNRGSNSQSTNNLDERYDNFSSPAILKFQIEAILIEFGPLIFGKKFVPVNTAFFMARELNGKEKIEGAGCVPPPYDSEPPPRTQIIGASSEYLAMIRAKIPQRKMLRPQFTPEEVHRPEYTYWNYPKAVTNYDMFEPGMVPILLNNGGIKKLICEEGRGDNLRSGDNVLVNYFLYIEGSEYCVDSNKKKRKPHSLALGYRRGNLEVLELATLSMKVKEVAAFLATPEYAHGFTGTGVSIPRDKRVLLIIEVLARLSSPSDSSSILNMVTAERKLLPFWEIYNFSMTRKRDADYDLQKFKYPRGLLKSFQVVSCLLDASARNPRQERAKNELLLATYGSICHASFATNQISVAGEFAKKATLLPIPEQYKAMSYFWCAKALYLEKKSTDGQNYIDTAATLMRGDKAVVELQKLIHAEIEKENKGQRKGSLKDLTPACIWRRSTK